MNDTQVTTFGQLALAKPVLDALVDVGYETPSPIQALTIPIILEGRDVLGQAHTGTGKTAAFALPLLSMLDLKKKPPQVLVLAPTRELAIQVAEAFHKYAGHMKGFHVLPVYGGQDYGVQIRALNRGVHVVVGTPGRVMDHMRRGTLKLDGLTALVLDEADEMLRMGFIDDVEWVLTQTPPGRQIALFSATLPKPIRRIAAQHLDKPVEVIIKVKTSTAETIRQRFWPVSGVHKLDALTRILEAEPFDAMLVFVRTRTATVELSEKLEARGFASAPLNGDIAQAQRERTVRQLKDGKLDILVATDVAARGLDLDRVSHVVNFDIPNDPEAYVHRIGRTGRAGRQGDAILFVTPREKRLLGAIERATGKTIEIMALPSTDAINNRRVARFKQRVTDTLESGGLDLYRDLVSQYHEEHKVPMQDIAAALVQLVQGDTPFLLKNTGTAQKAAKGRPRPDSKGRDTGRERPRPDRKDRDFGKQRIHPDTAPSRPGAGMDGYRVEVGLTHGATPADLVGAIAGEAGIDGKHIGKIRILDDHAFVELPEGMPREIYKSLKKIWVRGRKLEISRTDKASPSQARPRAKSPGHKPAGRKKPGSSGPKARKAAGKKSTT